MVSITDFKFNRKRTSEISGVVITSNIMDRYEQNRKSKI